MTITDPNEMTLFELQIVTSMCQVVCPIENGKIIGFKKESKVEQN